jgi:hypothetical protein
MLVRSRRLRSRQDVQIVQNVQKQPEISQIGAELAHSTKVEMAEYRHSWGNLGWEIGGVWVPPCI